jgi:glycosyltransferase involved in cell wall biosynthesis
MISVLVPTRNRPANVRRLLSSAFETAETDVEFLFYVDDDDPTGSAVAELVRDVGGRTVVGDRIVLSQMWNELARKARHDVMMHCGDDIVFRSGSWDARVLDEFDSCNDKILFVHGDDGYQHNKIGTHGFLHRNWVDAVGYFVPPYFSSDYNDLWLTEVADALGRRRYLPEVYTEHMHPVIGKGEWDQTHQDRLVRHQADDVGRIYANHAGDRARDVHKLREWITAYGCDE